MSQIKYIFRDFWWTVAKLDIKDTYLSRIAKLSKMSKNTVAEGYDAGMDKFRRGEIDEKIFRKIIAKHIQLPIHEKCLKIFSTPLCKYALLYKSIVNYVGKLQKLGYKCVIFSDDINPQGSKVREIWRYDYFDDVALSYEIGLSKYDDRKNNTTKIFRHVLKKYKLRPEEAVFIDDMEGNCAVAENLWIKTVLAQNPRQTIRDIKKVLHI